MYGQDLKRGDTWLAPDTVVEPEIPNLRAGGSRAFGLPGYRPGEFYNDQEMENYFTPEHTKFKPAWTSVYQENPMIWLVDQVNLRRYFKIPPW